MGNVNHVFFQCSNVKIKLTILLLNFLTFYLAYPEIYSVAISGSSPEDPIQIYGAGFGLVPGALVIGDVILGPILNWNDTYVKVVGPSFGLTGSTYLVQASGYVVTSNLSFSINKTDYLNATGGISNFYPSFFLV
jgi:hypothetical protein